MIRVLLADDHVALREAMALLLEKQPDMQVIGNASDGVEAVDEAVRLAPDVLLIDISMPRANGIQAIEAVRKRCPQVRTLVFTTHADANFLRTAIAAGACGYVTKDQASRDLLQAIRDVARGHTYINLPEAPPSVEVPAGGTTPPVDLSPRERQVLTLVAQGHTSREIAEQLNITRTSVDTYRARVCDKLGLKTRAELVRYALETGLLSRGS